MLKTTIKSNRKIYSISYTIIIVAGYYNDNDEYLKEKKELYNQNLTNCDQNAEYVFIAADKSVWFIDFIIGIAFKTPIDFYNELNGLEQSSRKYKWFDDILGLQFYLDEIVLGQEIVIETTVNPENGKENDDPKILWQPKLILK